MQYKILLKKEIKNNKEYVFSYRSKTIEFLPGYVKFLDIKKQITRIIPNSRIDEIIEEQVAL